MERNHCLLAGLLTAVAAPLLLLMLSGCSKPPTPEVQEEELVTEEVIENTVDLSDDVTEVAPTEIDLEGLGLVLPAAEEGKQGEGEN